MFQTFIKGHSGSRWGYNGYVGECLSLVKLWLDTLAGKRVAPASGNGKGSGYYTNFPAPLSNYFTKKSYDPRASYPAGSLVVYTRTSHIGMLVDNQPSSSNASVFEQNADPDGSPAGTHQRPKSHIDGILVLNTAAPAPSNSGTGQRLYFDPAGQTATFYRVKDNSSFSMKNINSSWSVLENQGNRARVNSASAGGDCWVYLKYSNTGNTIAGRSVR